MCNRFNILTLEHRRIITDIAVLYKIINSQIDSPYLLSMISFNVPTKNLRFTSLFKKTFSHTNSAANSPVNRMLEFANSYCTDFDFFSDNLFALKCTLK